MKGRLLRELLLSALSGGVATAALVLLAWTYVLHGEETVFEFEAGRLKEAVLERLGSGEAMLKGFQAYFHASQHVDTDEFRVYSESIFTNYPHIRAAYYSPRIAGSDREAFVEEQRYWGYIDFDIFDSSPGRQRTPALKRPWHFPVIYREPFSPEGAALLGFDLLSDEGTRQRLEEVVTTAEAIPHVSGGTDPDAPLEYRLLIAIYEGKSPPKTAVARRRKVNGLLTLVLDPVLLFASEGIPTGLRVRLESQHPGREGPLFRKVPEHAGAPLKVLADRYPIRVSRQHLILEVSKPLYLKGRNLWFIVTAAGLGLLFTLGTFLIIRGRGNLRQELTERRLAQGELARHRDHLEEIVAERTELLEKARDDAESANRAKSEFLANMSHELRTPLNAILGFAQLMRRDPQSTPEQGRNLDTICTSGQHLLSLINDVLNMARVEAGKLVLQEESFEFAPFLTGVAEMIRVRAEHERLFFTVTVAPGLCRFIRADKHKLRQVLINLLGNAVKFTEKGGVTLKVSVVSGPSSVVKTEEQGTTDKGQKTICFEVEDTGPGMTAEDLGRIFEPFVQTTRGRRPLEGTGLGLAISRRFVELMGGEIGVESEVGKGSLFRFEIPCVECAGDEGLGRIAQTRTVIGLASGQSAYRILVVEDREESRLLLRKLLESVGFEVAEAADGEEGVRLFESWHPDLIWMDMRMPVMDGYEATRRIKASEIGKKTVVIALTASAFEEDRKEVLAAGCDDFVRKPLDETEIFDAMARHLGVRYLYKEEEAEKAPSAAAPRQRPTPQSLAKLPGELLSELREALEALDTEAIGNAIARIREIDPPLGEALQEMAEVFQYDKIMELLEP